MRRSFHAAGLTALVLALAATGCVTQNGNVNGNDNDNGNTNGNANEGGFIDNGLAAPGPLAEGVENVPPTGGPIFPPDGTGVARGEVIFLWEASDANGTNVDSLIHFSDQPDVFDNPAFVWGVRTPPGETEHRFGVQFPESGTGFWGIEITDGVNTIRRPADGVGLRFDVSESATIRLSLDDAILICPGSAQPAREVTTFRWSLGDTVPIRTQVFVSRAGVENPFAEPLRVFEVEPPTDNTHALVEADALPLGEELSWGLRIETADEVRFTFAGQLGVSFLVDENVPPSGVLVAPVNEAVFADSTNPFVLTWSADAGNCEDELASTLVFEKLNGAPEPANLFGSPIQLDVGGATEVNLVGVSQALNLDGGRWAWGVRTTDGTDAAELVDVDDATRNFRTFVRNTRPRFTTGPLIDERLCPGAELDRDTLVFTYADDNGADTVNVTLSFAADEADVFDDPSATSDLGAPSATGEVEVYLQSPGGDCLSFVRGEGFYGVTLDDGVNQPVQAVVEYEGPPTGACCFPNGSCANRVAAECDGAFQGVGTSCSTVDCAALVLDCNENGVPDIDDIDSGSSFDCNENGVPDECEEFALTVDAGTLAAGVIGPNNSFSGTLQGSTCPVDADVGVRWTVDQAVPGSEYSIANPGTLVTPFTISPATVGEHRFRITVVGTNVTDTVTLTLTIAVP